MTNSERKYFWRGIKHNISPCCIMFFENEWETIRKDNKEYGKTMRILTGNQGIIMCPECLTNRVADLHSKKK